MRAADETSASPTSTSTAGNFGLPRKLLVISGAMLIVRLVWIYLFREIDSDAYGHYFIALAVRENPTNINVHWVWLPFFHFLVAPFTQIGLTFRGVRIVNALLAALGPLLLFDATKRTTKRDDIALTAAIAYAITPLTNILGQSAMPEMLFITFVVASVFFAARDRAVLAGSMLALACLVRYEAWGGALALCIWWVIARLRRRASSSPSWTGAAPAFAFVAIPAAVIILYIGFRYWTDHELLWFFRGTKRFNDVQLARHAWTLREIISFPIILPWYVFGPTGLLILLGSKRAFPTAREATLPLGFLAFLLLSYYGGAAHAGERYLLSVLPFACVAIAFGAERLSTILKRPLHQIFAVTLLLIGVQTAYQLHRARAMAIAWDEGLRAREIELEKGR